MYPLKTHIKLIAQSPVFHLLQWRLDFNIVAYANLMLFGLSLP
ncbi:hypothetical protein PRUB_a1965 [Pseudoalteromonas rubra]|uniref:Uncharacterized protein n=1 Tax=Pseudoalteromonas rubra TaxID=43658 RepID=A0A8T0CGN3_9GAMM|nr:hypothetical protein PRUB_a1965 [Pseudoalteromonas rubra]